MPRLFDFVSFPNAAAPFCFWEFSFFWLQILRRARTSVRVLYFCKRSFDLRLGATRSLDPLDTSPWVDLVCWRTKEGFDLKSFRSVEDFSFGGTDFPISWGALLLIIPRMVSLEEKAGKTFRCSGYSMVQQLQQYISLCNLCISLSWGMFMFRYGWILFKFMDVKSRFYLHFHVVDEMNLNKQWHMGGIGALKLKVGSEFSW